MRPVCAVVPAFNEADGILDATLSSLAREVGPENVYLTTDGSTDATAEHARHWLPIENVEGGGENRGKARALCHLLESRGLPERYAYVFQCDADTVVGPGHVRALLSRVGPEVAVAIGRLESNYDLNRTVYGRYRAYAYVSYNWTIRRTQDLLGVVNVLPGSSVLFRSDVLERMDWDAVGKYRLDDFRQLLEVRTKGLGAVRYYPDTPPAYILEPFAWADYSAQFKRWLYGIGEIVRGERAWRHWRNRAVLWDLLHLGSWVFDFLMAPVYLALAVVAALHFSSPWLIVALVAWGVGQQALLLGVYVAKTGRVSAVFYAPVFALLGAYEGYVATRGLLGLHNESGGAAWRSPGRGAKGNATRGER